MDVTRKDTPVANLSMDKNLLSDSQNWNQPQLCHNSSMSSYPRAFIKDMS